MRGAARKGRTQRAAAVPGSRVRPVCVVRGDGGWEPLTLTVDLLPIPQMSDLTFDSRTTGTFTAGAGGVVVCGGGLEFVDSTMPDTTPPSLVGAEVTAGGDQVTLAFDEDLAGVDSLLGLLASALAIAAGGQPVSVDGYTYGAFGRIGPGLQLYLSGVVTRGQEVVVSYTDPTPGDDDVALQDLADGGRAPESCRPEGGAPASTAVSSPPGRAPRRPLEARCSARRPGGLGSPAGGEEVAHARRRRRRSSTHGRHRHRRRDRAKSGRTPGLPRGVGRPRATASHVLAPAGRGAGRARREVVIKEGGRRRRGDGRDATAVSVAAGRPSARRSSASATAQQRKRERADHRQSRHRRQVRDDRELHRRRARVAARVPRDPRPRWPPSRCPRPRA